MKKYFSYCYMVFIYFLGGLDISLQSLIVLMILDFATGIFYAIKNKSLNSKICEESIIKKSFYFVIITLAVIIDKLLNQDGLIRQFTIYYYISNEGLSILENLIKLKVPLPEKLINCFKELNDEKK